MPMLLLLVLLLLVLLVLVGPAWSRLQFLTMLGPA